MQTCRPQNLKMRQFFMMLPLIFLFSLASSEPVPAVEQRLFISVPILGVIDQNGKKLGAVQYLAVQVDRLPQKIGPEIQFSEGSRALGRLKGGALSPDWKQAAHTAVVAASRALDEDPRTWLVTIKNVGNAYLTDGPSASAALAVALLAAFRGDPLLPETGMTGALEADGRISFVGAVPEKIQGAASGGLSTVLIPQGQSRTAEWDIRSLSENLHVRVIEVRTLREAYEGMTGRAF
jgi:predicted ATP-dependent protease